MSGLFPAYILREVDNAGRPLSNGLIWTYKSGTTIPKPVYMDAALTVPWTNPVVLDASGSADIFLGEGAYGIQVQSSTGTNIRNRIDGITAGSGGSSINSNATSAYVKTYNDLRALQDIPDTVYVAGNLAEGDGGAGQFQLIPGSSLSDDGGVILTSGSGTNVYKRVYDLTINPEWYGVRYGVSTNQYVAWNAATAGSARWNSPVDVLGGVYFTQNVTVPTGAQVTASVDGYFYSGSPLTMTFADGSKFDAISRTFSDAITPKFGVGVASQVKLSWMAGVSDDDRLTKFLASSGTGNANQTLLVDDNATTSLTSVVYPGPLEFDPNFAITFATGTAGLTLNLPGIVGSSAPMLILPSTVGTATAVNFGTAYARPEWFGPVAAGADDSRRVYYALASGHAYLDTGKTYKILSAIPSLPNYVEVIGSGVIYLGTGLSLLANNLVLNSCGITLQTPGNWFTGNTFTAYNAVIPSTLTATYKLVEGTVYSDKAAGLYPVSDGKPQIYNGHLPLILNADTLATDANGKIYGKQLDEYEANWNINALTTVGGTGNATRGFGETPTQLIKSDSTTSFWVRDKFDTFAAWSRITPNIPYAYASQRTIEFVWYAGSSWYAATSCTNGTDFHAEIFRSTDPTGVSSWTLLNTAPAATQFYQQWTGFRQLSNGTVYITKGALNDYVYGQIYKVVGTSVTVIPYGLNTTNLNVLALDEPAGYLYFAAQSYDYTGMFMLRMELSNDTVANVAGVGILQCMAFLGTGDTAIAGIGTGGLYYISNLKSTTFAPVFTGSWSSFNMNAIRTMVNAGYTVAAGGDGGLIGVTQAADTWQPALGTGGGNNRYFSRRFSGVEGLTYNTVAYNFTCSYYVVATGETLLGGTGSSVINRY